MRVRRYNPLPNAVLRLFCFPYAGGGLSIFRTWPNHLPPRVEVCSVELPGRDGLVHQPPFTQLLPLVDTLTQTLDPYLAVPFVLFGHSMGGLVSFELARVLRKRHRPTPMALFVSGHRAAHLPDQRPPRHLLPEPEFIAEMHRLQGTPEEVFRNKELMELFMPILRADFSLCETYAYMAEAPLDCPITAFGGLEDSEVSHDEIAAWRAQTYTKFTLHMFPGNHFFVHTARARLLEVVSQELTLILRQLELQAQ